MHSVVNKIIILSVVLNFNPSYAHEKKYFNDTFHKGLEVLLTPEYNEGGSYYEGVVQSVELNNQVVVKWKKQDNKKLPKFKEKWETKYLSPRVENLYLYAKGKKVYFFDSKEGVTRKVSKVFENGIIKTVLGEYLNHHTLLSLSPEIKRIGDLKKGQRYKGHYVDHIFENGALECHYDTYQWERNNQGDKVQVTHRHIFITQYNLPAPQKPLTRPIKKISPQEIVDNESMTKVSLAASEFEFSTKE